MKQTHHVVLFFEERIKLKKPVTAVLLSVNLRKSGIIGYLTGTPEERSIKQAALTRWLDESIVPTTSLTATGSRILCEGQAGPPASLVTIRRQCPVADNETLEECRFSLPVETMTALMVRVVANFNKT